MKENLKHIVRISATDLDGSKPLKQSLLKIKGVSHSMINAVCTVSRISKDKKTGFLKEEESKKIEEILKEPLKFKIPSWMVNREKDSETGEDKHLTGIDLKLRKDFDIKKLMRIKSYRGLRLSVGLPVRGQKTKSNFRPNKRKGKGLGVKTKKKGKKG
jgi:small subunit ribosomal protein S13